MSEVVVTRYELDIADAEKNLEKIVKGMGALDKSTDAAEGGLKGLENELGSASAKFKETAMVAKALETSLGGGLASRAKEASTLFGRLREATGGTLPALRALGKEVGVIASERFPKLTNAFKGLKSGIGQVGGALQGAFGQFGGYTKQLAGSIPVVGNLLVALGPVGIAAGAVAAGIFKIFTNLDAGATIVDGFKRSASIAFDQVTGQAKRLFDSATDGNTVFGKVFSTIGDGLKFVLFGLNPLVQGFNLLFKSAIDAGQEIAKLYDDLDEAQTNNILKNAQLEGQVTKLAIQLKDRTKTEEERLKIADQITEIETRRAAEEQKLLKQATAAVRREALEQVKAKGEVDDALKRRLAESLAAEENAATASTAITERAEVRRNAIIEQGEAERNAIAAKEAAAQAKRDAEAVAARAKRDAEIKKLEEARVNAAQQAATLEASLAERTELAGLEGVDRRVREVEIGYEKERAAAEKLFSDLAALYPNDAAKRAEIAQQSADVIAAITESEIAATTALRNAATEEEQKKTQQALDDIRQLIVSRDQLEQEAIQRRFDQAGEAAKKNIADAEELAATLVAIENARSVAILQSREEEANKLADLRQQEEDAERNLSLARLDAAIAGTEILKQLAGDNAEAAKALLAIQKAAAIAQIIVQTAAAIQGALAAAALNPLVAAGGPAAIAAFAAPTVAKLKIGAGVSIATILAQAISGAYEGGIVGEKGVGTKFSNGKDGYLLRVHRKERILPAAESERYRPYLDMMRDGQFEKFLNTTAQLNSYSTRATSTTASPGFNDRRIVGALSGISNAREQRKQTELLALVASGLRRGTNARYTA
jgi:hypothetical protein